MANKKQPSESILRQYKELGGKIKAIKMTYHRMTDEALKFRKQMSQLDSEYEIPSDVQLGARI